MPNEIALPDGFRTVVNVREPQNAVCVVALPAEYIERVDAWFESHPCTSRDEWKAQVARGNTTAPQGGAFGGEKTWLINPTTVGVFVAVRCGCGQELEDVTDLAGGW